MLVGYGDNGVLLIGIVDEDLETLKTRHTLTYHQPKGVAFRTTDIVVCHAATKEALVAELRAGGVKITEQMTRDYLAGKRTDSPPKPF